MNRTLRVLSLLALPTLAACGATFQTLDFSSTSPKVVEVAVDTTGPGRFTLRVKNLGDQPLTVHRDHVVLRTVKGDRIPLPAGNDTDVIEPGQMHPLVVSYATKDLPWDTIVSLRFDSAFGVGTADASPPAPMKFKVGSEGSNG